jgi:AhpD family alkylhydroperoxidase
MIKWRRHATHQGQSRLGERLVPAHLGGWFGLPGGLPVLGSRHSGNVAPRAGRRPTKRMNTGETMPADRSTSGAIGKDGAMARVDLLTSDTAPITVQSFFAGGDPGPIVAALANVPELVGPTLGFIGAALGQGAASTRHKEFAILRTSALQGCQYCIHAHTTVALDVGLSSDEVRALRTEGDVSCAFADKGEQALIGWIDALAGATGPVPDEVWDAARAHWPAHILMELSVTVGATLFLNRFATGFALPTSSGTLERLVSEGFA